jgi:tungstate transport system substrate-binding protein
MKNLCRVAAAALTMVACLALSGVASADSPTTLTIVGTSDVSDSGLFQNVIAPQFKAAYPQYNIQYFGTASGTAITDAETGAAVSGGASVLLVHAASLENQFVANGYSYNNQPGYAVFRNDFVLAGPTTGAGAGVVANAPNNAAQAFADIAADGATGTTPPITFVSRGGTPGTTVEEHAIWAYVSSAGLQPSSLTLCTVSAANGGGETPVASGLTNSSGAAFANGEACSDLPAADLASGLPAGNGLPDWYVTTGANQGQNVIDSDQCTTGTGGTHGIASPADTCYVLTDRGTYDYLLSGNDPAGKITHLSVVTRDNSATAPGGAYALINYFHAYIINQAKVQSATGSTAPTVNLPAAQDLITLLTSPSFQASLQNYLAFTGTTPATNLSVPAALDAVGPPFIGDASPGISAIGLNGSHKYGASVTVTGTVTNPQPGYPVLASQPVTVDEIVAGVPIVVAKGKTNSTGAYSVKFTPKTTGQYQVETGQLTQIENSALSPTFSDTLSPAASTASKVTVTGAAAASTVRFSKVKLAKIKKKSKAKTDTVTVTGKLAPAPGVKGATVAVEALNLKTGKSKKIGHVSIKAGKATFTVKGKLNRKTRYALQLKYTQKGQKTLYSGLKNVTVK